MRRQRTAKREARHEMAPHNEASTQRAAPSQSPSFQWKPLTLHGLQNLALFTPNPPLFTTPNRRKKSARAFWARRTPNAGERGG